MSTIKQNDWLFEQLNDAEFAAEFLNTASEDDDPKTYFTALRKVIEARGLQVQAINAEDGVRIVGFKNERGKGDHCHIAGKELP
jgi:hypothetical protein